MARSLVPPAYERLCTAVISQAVYDYIRATLKLREIPDDIDANIMFGDVKSFFTGDIGDLFTTPFGYIDGEVLLSKLNSMSDTQLLNLLPYKTRENFNEEEEYFDYS